MKTKVYLDYASTTPVDPRVFQTMRPYFAERFGNPSSIHSEGVIARKVTLDARKSVALALQAHPDEIVFTSGGTESNNTAIFGVVRSLEKTGTPISEMHFVTTVIEHSSVLECFHELEILGAQVDYVKVKSDGIVDLSNFEKLLRENTVLVSVGYANNEIGVIQPIREISKRLRNFPKTKPLFHSDGSQAPLYLDLNVFRLGIDLLTLDGHKMYGPKGVGVLYVRRGVSIAPLLLGGGQEHGIRSTTENVPGIIGFATALEIATSEREKESIRVSKLRDYFYKNFIENRKIQKEVLINGSRTERLPNNINISLPGVDTEMLVLKLDVAGFSCSTKSSCLRDEPGSYVVKALGGEQSRANSTLRITLGRATTQKDINAFIQALAKAIAFFEN